MGQREGQGASKPSDRYARIAGQWVQRAWREPPPRLTGSSPQIVAAVERTLRQRDRRLKLARWTGRVSAGVAAAAAVGGLVLALRNVVAPVERHQPLASDQNRSPPRQGAAPSSPGPAKVRAARALLWAPPGGSNGVALTPGTRVMASAGVSVRIASAEGTELVLEPGGSLTVMELGSTWRFALLAGAVGVHVSKLSAGERFVIETADTEVEVHGTRFRVETGVRRSDVCARPGDRLRDPGPAGTAVATRVAVESGVVAVRWAGHEERLFPGDGWPAPCSPRIRSASVSRPPRSAAIRRKARTAERQGLSSSPSPISGLAAQNDLFSAAVAARRAGRTGDALSLFERLINEHPGSSLVESAMAAKMRLLAARGSGQEAAAAYLARFPDGFAREEAEVLLRALEVR